jgi:hypothetical protein
LQFKSPRNEGTVAKHGGDSSVERDGLGRPRIIVGCSDCEGTGTAPSPKTGKLIKCKPCGGEGANRKRSYTRVTTYIDVLESSKNLMEWKARKVLQGCAMDPTLTLGVTEYDDTEREGRDWLNRRAEVAATIAGASKKAEKGTYLHELSELRDRGEPLPEDASEQDRADIEAYHLGTTDLVNIHLMEQLVVNDELQVAGTPDRVSYPKMALRAPDGQWISVDEKLITDLKTGRVDYGGLKMAMQLSIYSRSDLYYPDGTRMKIPGVNQDWGLIMHLPAGSGELTLYWADLNLGWEAVQLAGLVRSMRSRSKAALIAA